MNKIFGSEKLYNALENWGQFLEKWGRRLKRAGAVINVNEKSFLTVFTIIFLSWALLATFKTARIVMNSEKTEGVITEFIASKGRSSPERRSYYPVIKFNAVDGREYKFQSGTNFNGREYRVSDRVKVIYRTDRPEMAEIDSLYALWFVPGLLFVASGIGIAGLCGAGGKKNTKDPELAFLEANSIDKHN